ncbi:hypothetical protein ma136 [Moumouvirus australiensis]|uniref:Uncharacterized protein n=1 Tax=Moumouvirus australiensis TaxID=2109587 RepID=A0A2P1EKV0_9VIRU|nr:hypothetical protein QKC55_gp768 [Moumouvirus australiensis]AVL94522.1 hypothetical protein ma136 [Moumouvirus australiensis]
MSNLIKRAYYYPLEGTGFTNIWAYKIILGLQGCCAMNFIKKKLLEKYTLDSYSIRAYNTIRRTYGLNAVTNKLNFHMAFNIRDRIPTGTEPEDFLILKTSGSTSGIPCEIPISAEDITRLRNYYLNLAAVAGDDIMPRVYKYINMFPASDSSTGQFSELLVPDEYRLERSDADPNKTIEIIKQALDSGDLEENTPLVVGGLPILHLMLLENLQDEEINDHLKKNGICIYGGESPTINEKLRLYKYYNKLFGIYGSTEMGPKLGFSNEPNIIVDIALTIPEFLAELTDVKTAPISFFYDKYLHHYEIINGNLVNTPLIQQAELKIRWDQEDGSEIINPQLIKQLLERYQHLIQKNIQTYDEEAQNILFNIFDKLLYSSTYNKLFKYYGMILFYGRKGVIFGGANLDSKFVEIVHQNLISEERHKIEHLALYRGPTEDNDDITTSNYSGLRLDILVETNSELDEDNLLQLKYDIIRNMEVQHHDFEQIMIAYRNKNQEDTILQNIKLWAFNSETSPMHDRHIVSGKRIYIIKQLDEKYNDLHYAVV